MSLKLKIFPPNNLDKPKEVICNPSSQPLTLGRSEHSDICIDDKLISKTQFTIKYIDEKWYIEDGNNGKESTNGTWYYLGLEYTIYDGMIFK